MSPDERAAIGDLVRRRRAAQRVSQEAMAGRAPMSAVTWGRVEDGKSVRIGTYAGVEAAFGWPLGSLTRYAETREEPPDADVEPVHRPGGMEKGVLESNYPDAVKVLLIKALRADGDPIDALLHADAPDGNKVKAIRALRELQAEYAAGRADPERPRDHSKPA
ncbi:helix-turn-helix domain-containing protein [Micromonospora sp. NPDC047465]|uniref:helix-turn-helix domain-containing protein n=1 Tax=Micromonospora sp. NPDC047465 TaxID=3154813 RepID=UPI0033EA077E